MDLTKAVEYLALLPQIFTMIKELRESLHIKNKKWLSTQEVSEYIPFSISKINKMLNVTLIEGIHFYKKEGKKIFDREALDKWITARESANSLTYKDNSAIVADVLHGI